MKEQQTIPIFRLRLYRDRRLCQLKRNQDHSVAAIITGITTYLQATDQVTPQQSSRHRPTSPMLELSTSSLAATIRLPGDAGKPALWHVLGLETPHAYRRTNHGTLIPVDVSLYAASETAGTHVLSASHPTEPYRPVKPVKTSSQAPVRAIQRTINNLRHYPKNETYGSMIIIVKLILVNGHNAMYIHPPCRLQCFARDNLYACSINV